MSSSDSLSEFLKTNCDMKPVNLKKIYDGLAKKNIDGLKILNTKAKNGSLKPILEAIAKEEDVDIDYVGIILSELAKLRDQASDDQVAGKKKEVEAAVAAAREYRQAAATQNKETLNSTYANLDAALQRIAPDAGWNVPAGVDLLPQLDQLIKDIDSLKDIVVSGNYGSDIEMLPQISDKALCKAAIFLPGRPIGRRADKVLFKLPSDITKNVLSETNIYEAMFSNNAVSAAYQNDLTIDGSANTFNAEGGAFFGVGAFALSGSYSGGSASDRSSRINTLSETREAVGIKVHALGKASVTIDPEKLVFDFPSSEGVINSVEKARIFLNKYGTHVIVAPQVLGGLYILKSTVTFAKNVRETSYKEALSTTLSASAGASGWGVFDGGIFGGSAGGGHNSTQTEAKAGGTTSSGDTYSATTNISMKGPSCVNAASFRASLDNGNKSWCFINNGLKLDFENRNSVVNQIAPVWDLFERAGRSGEAGLLRNAWLDMVVDTDAALDPNSFFGMLVEKALHIDTLQADGGQSDWTRPYLSKIAALRIPTSWASLDIYETLNCDPCNALLHLSPHAVGFHDEGVLTQFQLHRRGDSGAFYYSFKVACVNGCGQRLTTNPVQQWTEYKEGADKAACRYLDRHPVRGPAGTVLTGFQLEFTGDYQVRYRYKYTQLYAGAVKFSYRESDVKTHVTEWRDGANKAVAYLDQQNVNVPDGHLLVGFHLVSRGEEVSYEFWSVAVSDVKPEVLLLGK